MKILVKILLITISVFLIFGEFGALGSETPPDHVVEYKSKSIKLWVDNTGRVTRATYPGSFDPTDTDYHLNHNYLIRMVEEEGFRFVAFLKENKRLLGVRAPIARDHLIHPEPTDLIWHIFCGKKHFRLTLDPITELEMHITLVPYNLPRQGLRPLRAIVAGIEFYVFRDPERGIVAATLPPRLIT